MILVPPPLRVLVVDDETSARRRLLALLAEEPGVRVVGESANGLAACEDIARLAPDLVFLDVEMPERNGLAVVEAIGVERMPATVFVTAYGHYAVEAFDVNAVDYLLKPFDVARFARAMAKVRTAVAASAAGGVDVARAAGLRGLLGATLAQPPATRPERLWVRSGDAREPVRVADLVHVAAEGNYVRLHTATGNHLMRDTLSGLLERLDPARFRRIHRSHVVNVDHVRKLLPWFGGDRLVMMSDGSRLTLSRSFSGAFEEIER
jgi:two-component system, LytTR family, response regulator